MSFTQCPLCRDGAQWHRIVEEGGVTDNSLHNSHVLVERFGKPSEVELFIDEAEGPSVKLIWRNKDRVVVKTHICSGYAWGYPGGGPNALVQLFNDILETKVRYTPEVIFKKEWGNGSSEFLYHGAHY